MTDRPTISDRLWWFMLGLTVLLIAYCTWERAQIAMLNDRVSQMEEFRGADEKALLLR